MEIAFKNIGARDRIRIRTQNSEYVFSITDPEERRGILSGGSLGEQRRDAVLIGMLPDTNSLAHDSSRIETGGRALFYLTARNGIERLITSIITDLSMATTPQDERRVA